MSSSRTKKQLRRCAVCQKVGHNKSTCPQTLRAIQPKSSGQPLRFFVHHVQGAPTHSPHVVDLKTENTHNAWSQVDTTAPATPEPTAYHAYHTLPVKPVVSEPTFHVFKNDASPELPVRHTVDTSKTIEHILSNTLTTPQPTIEELIRERTAATKKPKALQVHTSPRRSFLKPLIHTVSSSISSTLNATQNVLTHVLSPIRAVAVIMVIGLIIIIPSSARGYYASLRMTADTVAKKSTAGFMSLAESTAALKNADVTKAQAATQQAVESFNTALSTLDNNHTILQTVIGAIPIVNDQVLSRQKIILAGQEIAVGNSYLLKGINETTKASSSSLSDQLQIMVGHLKAAIPNYTRALDNLNEVDTTAVPLEYQSAFSGFRTLLSGMVHDFQNVADLGDALHTIFGGEGKRRYVVVFQNQNEIRPTGGFMGSFAVVDVKDGKVVEWELTPGGSYDLQGQLSDYIVPPTPLLLVNKRWMFQDANWFPDFPSSAEKMLWFYRHSGGVSADGVIAINASVLERLLSIMGPITDDKRQVTLTADNAIPLIQNIVETGPEKKDNKPKQILTDLAPTFISYFEHIKPSELMPLLVNFDEALSEKEIQFYFTDPDLEATINSYGWGGKIADTKPNEDYVMVVNTNLQGQKSDARIKQSISHEAKIESDGSIIDTVTITREHTGDINEKMYGQTNIDYLRLYVPQGSTLIAANGFTWPDEKIFKTPEKWYIQDSFLTAIEHDIGTDENSGTRITDEFGKTAFGNWVITEPGASSVVQFTYRLPFKLPLTSSSKLEELINPQADSVSSYRLIAQKQSGISSDFESQIIFPNSWHPAWHQGEHATAAENGLAISNFSLQTDATWAVILKK